MRQTFDKLNTGVKPVRMNKVKMKCIAVEQHEDHQFIRMEQVRDEGKEGGGHFYFTVYKEGLFRYIPGKEYEVLIDMNVSLDID